MYSKPDKKSFSRDLSCFQKKNVLRAWQYIEDHPKIEINSFFTKVLGYIRCMENQLWIWGFYRYSSDTDDELISASQFAVVHENFDGEAALEPFNDVLEEQEVYGYEGADAMGDTHDVIESEHEIMGDESTIVMEAVIDQDGILQANQEEVATTLIGPQQFESEYLNYICRE